MAEPWLNIISPPNKTKTRIIGNSQYFFLTFKNSQNSFKKLILKLVFHLAVLIAFFNPI